MGSLVGSFVKPQSPAEENHRVIGINGVCSSSVDDNNGLLNQREELIKWCRGSQTFLLERSFKHISADDKAMAFENGRNFRIMQWNTLADALGSGKDNFIKCPPEVLGWEQRKFQLLEEMLTYSPDIICCQEVDHFDGFFNVQLSKVGYRGSFLPKPWSPCLDVHPNNGPDGCAVFFKADKFELVDYKAITLKTMKFWANHVALFHILKFKKGVQGGLNIAGEEERTFLVGTTHLKAKAGFERLRESQGKDILRFLEPYTKSGTPIILCGDFNAKPEEAVYDLMRNCNSQPLESAYAQLSRTEPPYTTWCVRPAGQSAKTVDYIFYSKTAFAVRSILEIPTPDVIGPNGLPSRNYPSDHLSLVCDMELLTERRDVAKSVPKI